MQRERKAVEAWLVPDAQEPNQKNKPCMTIAVKVLRLDPIYEELSRRFWESPKEFEEAFAKA